MSHVSDIELQIQSLDELKQACMELGLTFKENQKTYAWYGRWIGDAPLPPGMKVEDLGKCDHAIKVPGCEYEIGIIGKCGDYRLLWDYWHSGGLEKALGKKAGKFKQAYASVRIRRQARLKGCQVGQSRTKTGLRLVLSL
jgi:hypothetical protein